VTYDATDMRLQVLNQIVYELHAKIPWLRPDHYVNFLATPLRSLLLRRGYCTFNNGKYVKRGLSILELRSTRKEKRNRQKSFGKKVILDFENLAVHLASTKRDLRNFLMESRSFHDDGYASLFQQSGSVETEGQSSSVCHKQDAEEVSFLMRTPPTTNVGAARVSQQASLTLILPRLYPGYINVDCGLVKNLIRVGFEHEAAFAAALLDDAYLRELKCMVDALAAINQPVGAEMGAESEMKGRCLGAEMGMKGGGFGAEIAAKKGGFGR
ncbi:hypothetical protein Tco_1426680, partial [Tanacetum coccineum]